MAQVRFGITNSRSTVISAYVGPIGHRRSVTLSADYSMEHSGAGFPTRPMFVGLETQPAFPYPIPSGATIEVMQPEADALIAARRRHSCRWAGNSHQQ